MTPRRSYLTNAIVTLGLYALLWFPGALVNLLYLRSAQRERARTGQTPEGHGCLLAMFLLLTTLPIVASLAWVLAASLGLLGT